MSPAFSHDHKVLFVLTSHSRLGDSGKSTGYTVSEAADPWKVFSEAGWDVHITTVKGGPAPEDGFDPDNATQVDWKTDPHIQRQMHHAPAPEHVNAAIYDVVYFVGGHGTMWDFAGDTHLSALAAAVYEQGGVVAAVCHGPAALTTVRLTDGSLLIEGKQVTGFSNAEEKAIKLDKVVPFLLADKLTEVGGDYSQAGKWQPHVITDGRLVTGQNPASAAGVAEAAIAALHS
jgi:putative intracellular protease/amidase